MPLPEVRAVGIVTPVAPAGPVFHGVTRTEAVRTVKSWVEQPRKLASKRQRKAVVRNWVIGNRFLEEIPDTHPEKGERKSGAWAGRVESVWHGVYEASERGVSALRNGTLDIYQSINAMIEAMRNRGASESTIFGHKFKLVKMLRYLKLEVDKEELKDVVSEVESARITDDKELTPEQIRACLLHGTTKQKALISFMVCTGARIGETVQVKLSDIYWDEKPVRVEFPARKTKTQNKRYSFVSSECVQLIKTHVADRNRLRKSDWLFEGYVPTEKREAQADKHISTASAYYLIRGVFETIGLIPPDMKSNKTKTSSDFGPHHSYHPNVLRGTNLSITKGTGYPADYAEFLAGHTTGSKENYFFVSRLGPDWLSKCEPAFCFLTDTNTKEKVDTLEQKVKELEKGIEIDKQILEEQIVAPAGSRRLPKFETRRISLEDEEAYIQAIADGFVEAGRINHSVIMKRVTS